VCKCPPDQGGYGCAKVVSVVKEGTLRVQATNSPDSFEVTTDGAGAVGHAGAAATSTWPAAGCTWSNRPPRSPASSSPDRPRPTPPAGRDPAHPRRHRAGRAPGPLRRTGPRTGWCSAAPAVSTWPAAASAGWCGYPPFARSAWTGCASPTYGTPRRPSPRPRGRPPRSRWSAWAHLTGRGAALPARHGRPAGRPRRRPRRPSS
jgi:hypothetical protein